MKLITLMAVTDQKTHQMAATAVGIVRVPEKPGSAPSRRATQASMMPAAACTNIRSPAASPRLSSIHPTAATAPSATTAPHAAIG